MIIFGSTLSPYVRKVVVVAAEKGIDIDLQPTGSAPGQPSEEFLAASPLRKMPALQDGGFRLADSSAIVHYLEAKFPDKPMIPADPEGRGRTIWFEEYADTTMMSCGGKIFFNRFVAPMVFKRPGDESIAAAAEREELPLILDYLETVMPEGDGFLIGDRLTLADIAIASPFATLGHTGIEVVEQDHPKLARFLKRMFSRPSFSACIERERAFMERFAA